MRLCSITGCEKKHHGRGLCGKHYMRWRNNGDPNVVEIGGSRPGQFSGDRNPNWRGNEVGYVGAHKRLYAARGQPNNCEWCGETDPGVSYEWALNKAAPTIAVRPGDNGRGPYSLDPHDYLRLCIFCHRTYDAWGAWFEGHWGSPGWVDVARRRRELEWAE